MTLDNIQVLSRFVPVRLMAVIRGVRYGVNGIGNVGLSFGVYVSEGVGAPLFFPPAAAEVIIRGYDLGDVARLEGKPCWVVIHNGEVKFDAPCLI